MVPGGSCSKSACKALAAEHSLSWQGSQLLDNLHAPTLQRPQLLLAPLFPENHVQPSKSASPTQQLFGSLAHKATTGTMRLMLQGKANISLLQWELHKVREGMLKTRLLFISSHAFTVCSTRTMAFTRIASNPCTCNHRMNFTQPGQPPCT